MDLLQTILNAQGGQTVNQVGQHVGLDQDQTVAAIQGLLPALAGGLAKNTGEPGGLERLLGALTSGAHQRYIDAPGAATNAGAVQDGNGILGHILGSKDVSRQVAAQASAQTGIGADILKKLLPMVATLAMGALSKRAAQPSASGPFGSLTGGSNSGGGGLMDMLGPLLGGSGSNSTGGGGLMDSLGKIFRH